MCKIRYSIAFYFKKILFLNYNMLYINSVNFSLANRLAGWPENILSC
jgi:hypothetical protein